MQTTHAKRIVGLVMATLLSLQPLAPIAFAEASEQITPNNDALVIQGTPVEIETGETATPETSSSEDEQQADFSDKVVTVTIDANGGNLPADWIETANNIYNQFGIDTANISVEAQEKDGLVVVTTKGLSSLALMNPTPEENKYFVGWTCEEECVENESNTLNFQSDILNYRITAQYGDVVSESEQVDNARTYSALDAEDTNASNITSPISLFALKPTDSYTKLDLAMEGLEFIYEDGQIQTFTAPYDGEYIITAYGANGGTGYAKYAGYGVPGRGGMTEATVTLKQGQTIYMYLGEAGGDWSTERTFGGGGGGVDAAHAWTGPDDGSLHMFGRGGGATYVSVDEFDMANAGQAPQDFTDEQKAQNDAAAAEAKNHIIMLAAGGGGAGEYGSPYSHYGLNGGGYEGGILRHENQFYLPYEQVGMLTYDATIGGRVLTRDERIRAWIYPATQTRAGYGYHYSINGELYDPNPANKDPIELLYPEREARNWGSFFFGANAIACTGAGGGGWFGGGIDYAFDGGGGSSYIGTSITMDDGTEVTITDPETVAGANVKYDNTKSSPFYVNGRVLIKLKDGQAQISSFLQKAEDEDISKEHPDDITGDIFGQGVVFPKGETESEETVGYTAVIYYTPGPDTVNVTPSWEYNSFTNQVFRPWNDEAAKAINSDLNVNIEYQELGVLEPGDKYYREEYSDWNVMVTTMTISNVYLGIFDPANLVGYKFRASAVGTFSLSTGVKSIETTTEDVGGLTTRTNYSGTSDYDIWMQHQGVNTYNNANNINVSPDTTPYNSTSLNDVANNTASHESSVWAYPELIVETPSVLRTFNVLFTSPSRSQDDCINYDEALAEELGITVKGINQNYIFLQEDGLDKEQWTRFLRSVTFTTYEPLIIKSNGVEGGVGIEWAGFEDAIGADDVENENYPKLSDYSNVINHDIGKGNLNITQSGTVYHVTGSTSSNRISVASGVTTTIFLDNVSISTSKSGASWGKSTSRAGDGCIICSHANVTLVLMGTSYLTSNAHDANAIAKNGTDGQLIIDGNGTLYAKGNPNVDHAGAIGGNVNCSFWNFTVKNGTVYASAGMHCPGIGSGCLNQPGDSLHGDGKGAGNLRFEGGTVYAYGNTACSGIGSGWGGCVNGIYISNGANVTAYGGAYSPGIGAGGRTDTQGGVDANYFYNTSNIVITGGNTVVTAFGDKSTNMPGIGCGKDPSNSSKGKLTNVIAQTDEGFQGYVRYGSSEESAQYSSQYPKTPFIGVGDMGNYLAQQANAGKAVYYTQVFFSLDTNKKSLGDADIIGTQVEKVEDYTISALPSISGIVWAENDRNGIYKQGEEPVIPNATVKLVSKDGNVISTTTSSASGQFSFVRVPEGEYKIEFEIPADSITGDYEVTQKIPSGSESITNTVNADWTSDSFTAVRGENISTINCGVYVPSRISGFVWDDTNRNGIYESGEKKLEGVQVTLKKNSSNAQDAYGQNFTTIKTNKQGEYCFENVPASMETYEVVITSGDVDISNATVSPNPDKGTDPAISNVASPITYGDVSSNMKLDEAVIAGLYVPTLSTDLVAVNLQYQNCALSVRSLIYGYVWAETDYNGICDGYVVGNPTQSTEQLLSNVEVILNDSDGNQITKTTTSKTGYYEFSDIAAGNYRIEFVKANGFTAGGKVSADTIGFSPMTETPKAETNSTQLGNCTVGEYDENGNMVGLITDRFTVDEVSIADSNKNMDAFTKNVNAAMFAPSTVSGLIWEDYNQDGIRDKDEELLPGVSVTLMEKDGDSWIPVLVKNKNATIQTGQKLDILSGKVENADTGTYSFNGLSSGTYAIRVESGDYDIRFYLVSPQNVGDNDAVDSDAVGTYTTDGEELQFALISNVTIPGQSQMPNYGFEISHNDMGAYQKLRDVTVTKQIYADEIEWDHGAPIFMITVYGTDQKGVYHEYNHAYEFTEDFVRKNTDENGVVTMTYTFEDIPYARVYNVEEQNTSRYSLKNLSGSENATFEDERAILDLKYDVSGEVTFLNTVSHYRDTSANSLVTNSLLAG